MAEQKGDDKKNKKGKDASDPVKDSKHKQDVKKDKTDNDAQVDIKQKAKEVLQQLFRLTKNGTLPEPLYEMIVKYAGKTYGSEQQAIQFFTNMATIFVKTLKLTQEADPKEVQKVLNAFKRRRDQHGIFFNKWANYLNDPMCLWMFDYEKVWTAYMKDKL